MPLPFPAERAAVPLSQRKLVALDGVRGLAILAVMCLHARVQPFPLPPVIRAAFDLGWSGVDLFFVLSGFLITGILLDSRQCTNYFRSFYARRVLRIFPLYYGFLFLALLAFPYVVPKDFTPARSDGWLCVGYLMNWYGLARHWHHHILGHFWSLCVEEQFYLVWPLVVWMVGTRWLLHFVIALELAVLGGRWWWVWHHGASQAVTTATISRMDGLLLGAAAALLMRRFWRTRWSIKPLPSIAALFLSAFVVGYFRLHHTQRLLFDESVGYAMLAVGFAAFVLYSAGTDGEPSWQQAGLCWRPLVLFGKYSYGIYVFHYPLFYFLDELSGRLPPAFHQSLWFGYFFMAFKFAVAFGVASLSYNFFEKRFLALKDRFAPVYPEETAAARAESLQPALPLANS
jgi:peptidoglycan/LPS O-acetylase OafA/YrhL